MTNEFRMDVDGADVFTDSLSDASGQWADMAPPNVPTVIQSKARAAAPFVTGRLRGSITADLAPGRVTVGSDLIYAGVIHNGWAEHNISPNPFLIPVAENTASIWGPMYSTEARQIADRTIKGA